MDGTPSVAELQEHISLLRGRVLQVADDVKALLREDLPKFVERELKRAFVSHPEFASAMSDDTLRDLKKDIREEAQASTLQVLEALGEDALWFPADVEEEGDDEVRRSIGANEALWAAVNGICATVAGLREKYGFPVLEEELTYRAPTWFIGRRYLPSLSEKYWRYIHELKELEGQLTGIETAASKTELTSRWDDV